MSDAGVTKEQFEAMVRAGGGRASALADAAAQRRGDPMARFRIAAQCLYVALLAPEMLVEVYDALAEAWLGRAPQGPAVGGEPVPGEVPAAAWDAIWELVLDPEAARGPSAVTVRTAAVTGLLSPETHRRVAAMALRYPDVAEAAATGMPPKFTLGDLAACPANSLGGRLHSLVVDKGFDLEVLDRDSLGLAELPAPLDYLNVRILQCHDVWHEMAGYETTGLHEVAISGFQMAQFGHHYSSTFLGIVLAKVAFTEAPEATGFLLDTILAAYTHGRETPPLLAVPWDEVWAAPIDELRAQLGITPFESPYPAGLLEELRQS